MGLQGLLFVLRKRFNNQSLQAKQNSDESDSPPIIQIKFWQCRCLHFQIISRFDRAGEPSILSMTVGRGGGTLMWSGSACKLLSIMMKWNIKINGTAGPALTMQGLTGCSYIHVPSSRPNERTHLITTTTTRTRYSKRYWTGALLAVSKWPNNNNKQQRLHGRKCTN